MDDELGPLVQAPQSEYPPLTHYYSFFGGQLVSILGSEIVRFTLIWWITLTSQSAWYLSLASFLNYGVQILVSPVAGVFTDRWDRKKIIFWTDLFQAIVSIFMIILFYTEIATLGAIMALMGVSAGFAAFQSPAINAIVPVMVPSNRLEKINSLIFFSSYAMRMAGPMIGAFLLLKWRIDQILWLDCASFIFAVVPLFYITIPPIKRQAKPQLESLSVEISHFWKEFKEGLKTIKHAGILGLALIFPFSNLMETPKNILIPLLISKIYQGGAIIFAIVLTAAQLTTALTSFVLGIKSIPSSVPRQKIIVYGLIGIYLGSLIMIVPPEVASGTTLGLNVVYLVIGGILMGFCSPIINITMMAIVQKLVPRENLGRVEGFSSALSISLIPLGTLLTGYISTVLGIRLLILISGVIAIIGIIIFYFTTDLASIDQKLREIDRQQHLGNKEAYSI